MIALPWFTNSIDTLLGSKPIVRTTINPTSTVNITGLFFAKYRGSSLVSESIITLLFKEFNATLIL